MHRMLPIARCLLSSCLDTWEPEIRDHPIFSYRSRTLPIRWHDISTSYQDRNVAVGSFPSYCHGSLSLAVAKPVSFPSYSC